MLPYERLNSHHVNRHSSACQRRKLSATRWSYDKRGVGIGLQRHLRADAELPKRTLPHWKMQSTRVQLGDPAASRVPLSVFRCRECSISDVSRVPRLYRVSVFWSDGSSCDFASLTAFKVLNQCYQYSASRTKKIMGIIKLLFVFLVAVQLNYALMDVRGKNWNRILRTYFP